MYRLTEQSLLEIFKLLFRKKEFVEICIKHLEYHFIPNVEFKEIWQEFVRQYKINNLLPTFGTISQKFSTEPKIQDCLIKIKETVIEDEDSVYKNFENFLKDSLSIEFYDNFGDLYNKGSKEEARHLLREYSEKFNRFSIKDNLIFKSIFSGFRERIYERQVRNILERVETLGDITSKKASFGIDELDDKSNGGVDKGDCALFLAQSGVGKTKLLRWIGVTNAQLGKLVLHIQLEGTRAECEDGYDATWSAKNLSLLELGELTEEEIDELSKVAEKIYSNNGEIVVRAFEQFGNVTTSDILESIDEIERIYGKTPDVLLIDYLELMEPGDGRKYAVSQEKEKRQQLAKELKNIAVTKKTSIFTCTQASSVSPEDLNREDFVMTRYHISGDKGQLFAYSYFITLNQTNDEYENDVMRLYGDKFRKYKGKMLIRIAQKYDLDKFYDRNRTLREFYTKV